MNPPAHLRAADPAVDLRLLEDLPRIEAELAQQNDSSARSGGGSRALRRSGALFRVAPVGYLLVDGVATISRANPAACALLGAPAGSVEGTRLASWVARADRPAARPRRRLHLDARGRRPCRPRAPPRRQGHRRRQPPGRLVARSPPRPATASISLVDRPRLRPRRARSRRQRAALPAALEGPSTVLVIVDLKGRVRALNLRPAASSASAACDAVGRPAVDLFSAWRVRGLCARLRRRSPAFACRAPFFGSSRSAAAVAEAHRLRARRRRRRVGADPARRTRGVDAGERDGPGAGRGRGLRPRKRSASPAASPTTSTTPGPSGRRSRPCSPTPRSMRGRPPASSEQAATCACDVTRAPPRFRPPLAGRADALRPQ